ncbi:hypothetical protein OIU77_015119 [Salix suchowensis]|uniref:Disease resistance RPP13-like protein 4 n=1 Tax=Salix suchowensis TaxID=1278906 RepID=A0ABQ8ZSN0_9ROSI|nr:hypothetical protein OIU77_015119 [Salix suchowensis]
MREAPQRTYWDSSLGPEEGERPPQPLGPNPVRLGGITLIDSGPNVLLTQYMLRQIIFSRSNNEWTSKEVDSSILHRRRDSKAIDLSAGPIDESMKESELVLKFEAIDLLLQDLENSLLGVKAWEDKLVGHFTEMRLQIYKTLTNAKNKAAGGDIKGDLQLVEGKIKELNKVLEPPPDLGRTGQGSQENAEIKKRPLIYWWIGEGLIAATADKTAEEEGESIFQELMDLQFIEPYHEIPDKPSPDINACKMHPWLRHLAISLAQEAWFWDVEVLQLGAWHCSPKHHIEVEKEEVLRGLRALKHLKYLSLRGISLITTIPASIGELLSLEILDLRRKHAKGASESHSSSGAKGFVIGNSKTSCKIDDLANLKELRRLGIVVGNEAVDREGEFTKLKEFKKLHSLTIWWGAKSLKQAVMDTLTFPPSLEKLDLRGTPHANPPKELKPSTLQKLKKLYIRGGKITRLDDGGTDQLWNVEILRLKYLNDFKLNRQQLLAKFPQLGFLDVKCDKGVEYKEDIVLKSSSEIENYCKEKVVEKNAMPAENHNSEERKSLKKDKLGEEALGNKGKGKEVALKTEIEQQASTSY